MGEFSDLVGGLYRSTERSPLQTAIQAPAIPNRNAPRNRPPPRQMRPAEQRAMDPNAGVRRQAMGELERRNTADLATMPRTPRGNQFAEAGSMALEATGLPQVRRGAETLGDVAQAPYQPNAPMRALGGLGELGLGVASAATIGEFGGVRPRGRVPMREALDAPDPSPPLTRPPTQIAPNGMPIRPPQPFRQSLRGGNDDLAEAASFGRAPNTAPTLPMDEVSRTARASEMGFDMDAPLYHGTDQNIDAFRTNDGWYGNGVYASRSPQQAEYYTRRTPDQTAATQRVAGQEWQEPAPNIMPLVARGRLAPVEEYQALVSQNMPRGRWTKAGEENAVRMAQAEIQRRGYSGIDAGGLDSEVVVFDPSNVRSRFAAFDPARSSENDLLATRAPGIAPQQAPPRTSPRLFPSPNTPRPRPSAPLGATDVQPEGVFSDAPSVNDPPEVRMERARSLGFDVDTPLYRGRKSDYSEFDLSRLQTGTNRPMGNSPGVPEDAIFFDESPRVANAYVRPWHGVPGEKHVYTEGANILPAYARGNIKTIDMRQRDYDAMRQRDPEGLRRLLEEARSEGYDGVRFENLRDIGSKHRGSTQVAIFDPANIRSPFAAFDPARSSSRDLLAGYAPIGAGAAIGAVATRRDNRGKT